MHALDNLPTTEAILKKNKSRSFWQCPACPSILCHKTKSVLVENPDDPEKPIQKKSHFMLCSFCHWSTRDVGMNDAVSAGAWPEKENPHLTRVNEVCEYVKQVSSSQAFAAKTKSSKRISTRITGKGMGGPSPLLMSLSLKDGKPIKITDLEPPKGRRLKDMEPLDDEYYSESGVDFWDTTSLQQRFDQPEFQPERMKDLYPRRLTMGVKRSLRCRCCEHNLLKPEFSPSSIKFKMHLIATNYIPEIRLLSPPIWENRTTDIILTITNPTHSPVNVIMLPFCEENTFSPDICGQIDLPTDSYEIPAKDTLSEFDCRMEGKKDGDDDFIVRFTQPNKVGFRCRVKLSDTFPESSIDRWVAILLKHDYTDMLNQKTEPVWITQTVFVNLN